MNNSKFIFLMSSERSGSTLITKILDSHPNVHGATPLHLFRHLVLNLAGFTPLSNDANWKRLIESAVEIFELRTSVWHVDYSVQELLDEVSGRSLGELLRYIYAKELEASGKDFIVVKENMMPTIIPFIINEFPDAKIIWQTRDPRDMALSFRKGGESWGRTFANANGIMTASRTWQQDQIQSIRCYNALSGTGMMYFQRYEDVVSKPVETIKALCEFIGISFENEMLDFYKKEENILHAKVDSLWKNLAKPMMTDNFNKFRDDMEPHELAWVEKQCSQVMTSLGYQLESTTTEDFELIEKRLVADDKKLVEEFLAMKKNKNEDLNHDRLELRERRNKFFAHLYNSLRLS